MGVKVVRVVGDGVAVVVRPDSVRSMVSHGVELPGSLVMVWRSLRALMSFGVWLLMVWSCLDRDGCAHLPGLKRSERVGLCASLAPYIYIIDETKYFNIKTKNYLFLFGNIKITLYLGGRNNNKTK